MRAVPLVLSAVLLFALPSCRECPVGAEACACTPGGGCDQGLTCLSKRCVNAGPQLPAGSQRLPDGGVLLPDGGVLLPDGGVGPNVACTSNGGCASTEVCAYEANGATRCLTGSQRACDGGLCVHAMAFDRHVRGFESDMRGHVCTTSADCPVVKGHLLGVCVDADGTGATRACVPLCQYHDDATRMGCATDARFGVSAGCSRDHARALATVSLTNYCVDYRTVNARCAAPNANFSADLEWTVACLEGHLQLGTSSCATIVLSSVGCFASTYRPDGKLSGTQFLDEVHQRLPFNTVAVSGGSGGSASGQCRTDCDCGHCSYCEKNGSTATCRYAGEGPYGCYRGCD